MDGRILFQAALVVGSLVTGELNENEIYQFDGGHVRWEASGIPGATMEHLGGFVFEASGIAPGHDGITLDVRLDSASDVAISGRMLTWPHEEHAWYLQRGGVAVDSILVGGRPHIYAAEATLAGRADRAVWNWYADEETPQETAKVQIDIVAAEAASAIPEPPAWALLTLIGMVVALWYRRWRNA